MEPPADVRIDKWLWAVRAFKSRSLATHACSAGHVKVLGQNIKASHIVRPGEIVTARVGHFTRTLKVIAPVHQRVAAKTVPQYAEDLTPTAEYEKAREQKLHPTFTRPKGAGRPTKKDRRALDQLDW
jgi:ribosome-associated heat shock protein Hsp15